VRTNDAVRCLLITGEGRGFCAGDDFQEIFLDEDRANRKIERQINRVKHGETSLDVIFALEKPTGDLVDADEALRIGLVSKVVAGDSLLDEAHALARKLASGPPLAQQAVKRAMHKGFQMEWQTLGEYQQALGDVLWETDDHMEGVHSFTEKREPRFTGR
jgi:enoyl-CoA hydratase/carnithine racemase